MAMAKPATPHGQSGSYSISKSFVTRRRAADIALARQGEGDKVTDDLEMELPYGIKKAPLGTHFFRVRACPLSSYAAALRRHNNTPPASTNRLESSKRAHSPNVGTGATVGGTVCVHVKVAVAGVST